MRILIGDFETDSLKPTKIHCAAFQVYGTKESHVFRQQECYGQEIKRLLFSADKIVIHNGLEYDLPLVIHGLMKLPLAPSKIVDSLILSRMANYHRPGGHGLGNLGKILGVHKPHIADWSEFSEEKVHRCVEDVEINYRVYDMVKQELVGTSQESIDLEHKTQWILNRMRDKGFYFDYQSAHNLYTQIEKELAELEVGFRKDFPAVAKPAWKDNEGVYAIKTKRVKAPAIDANGEVIKERNPETNKMNTVYREWTEMSDVSRNVLIRLGIPPESVVANFCPLTWEEFNPGSPDQIVQRLDQAGWKPVNFRKATPQMEARGIYQGSPIVSDEENLETLPESAPESIRKIADYLVLRSRGNMIKQWLDVCTPHDSRVHGRIISLGARTTRCAHQDPNTGNIPAGDAPFYGHECRTFWTVPDLEKTPKLIHPYRTKSKRVIVGVDAAGIQGRILCHYMDDPVYTHVTVSQDIHSYNMFAAGIDPGEIKKLDEEVAKNTFGYVPSLAEARESMYGKDEGFEWKGRDKAKRFYYAFLLGAGDKKVTQITGRNGREVKENFFNSIPSLKELIDGRCRRDFGKGYFEALDGRRITLEPNKPHKVLSVYLQSGEAIIMKTALCKLQEFISMNNWDVFIVGFVHDEFVIDAPEELAEDVLGVAKQIIIETGEEYGLKCPLGASGSIGQSWAHVH